MSVYVTTRRRVRSFVKSRPRLDQAIGKTLVRADIAMAKAGLGRARLQTDQATYDGFVIACGDAGADIGAVLATNGVYEPETVDAIRSLLRPGDTFIDLGAHIGFHTLVGGRAVAPDGSVQAFEPTPDTRRLLETNISTNDLDEIVHIHPYAASDRNGEARFLTYDDAQANSVALPGEAAPEGAVELVVEMVRLDDHLDPTSRARLAKLDVEGQELAALRGMAGIIDNSPEMAIIFEYHRKQLARSGTDPADIITFLTDRGFTRFTVLFGPARTLDLPAQMDELERIASRANINVLAERDPSAATYPR